MKLEDFILGVDKPVFKGGNFKEKRKKFLQEKIENDNKKLLDKIEKKVIQILKKEGGAAGLDPIKKAVDKMDQPKGFNLKSTLEKMKNVEKHKNSDYILTPINEYNELLPLHFQTLVPGIDETKLFEAVELMEEEEDVKESLRQWFKDDWVRIDTQGNIAGKCGTMKKGKKTTRCLPRKKAQSLSKSQRKSTSAKKAKSKKQYVSNTKAAGGRKKRGRKKSKK